MSEGLNVRLKATAALVLLGLEILPLILHLIVHFEFRITLGIFVTKFLIYGNEVGKQQCVYTLTLIVGTYCHEQEVEHLRTLSMSALSKCHQPRARGAPLPFARHARVTT